MMKYPVQSWPTSFLGNGTVTVVNGRRVSLKQPSRASTCGVEIGTAMTAGCLNQLGGSCGRPSSRERIKCQASKIQGGRSSSHFRPVFRRQSATVYGACKNPKPWPEGLRTSSLFPSRLNRQYNFAEIQYA